MRPVGGVPIPPTQTATNAGVVRGDWGPPVRRRWVTEKVTAPRTGQTLTLFAAFATSMACAAWPAKTTMDDHDG